VGGLGAVLLVVQVVFGETWSLVERE